MKTGYCAARWQVPSINKTYASGKMYISAGGHQSFEGADGHQLAVEALSRARRDDVDRLERAIGLEAGQ